MVSRISRLSMRIWVACFMISALGLAAIAQVDTDPNSPTPVLLSENDSIRALSSTRKQIGSGISRLTGQAYPPDQKIILYATNIELMEGEGANAFRLDVVDKDGHLFRFPVLEIEQLTNTNPVFALTILLTDEIGYWPPPTADGDVLVSLTWRGLASNHVRLGIGHTGGEIKDPPGAVPTPLGPAVKKSTAKRKGISPNFIGFRWSGDRSRLLEQATFGPTVALDSRVRRIGVRTWLAEQFDAPYPTFAYPNQPLKPNQGNDPTCDGDNSGLNGNPIDIPLTCARDTYTMYQIQTWNSLESLYGNAQLHHRVAWALGQIWVTSGVDIQQSRHMVEYHKILSSNAFGNYRNLMKQMTLSPTMGDYLDMARSTRTNPNENYAREIMQLFTIGLFNLNPDGTVQCVENAVCQPGNTPSPTYDQNIVNNLTRVLTGWSFCSTPGANCPNIVSGAVNFIDPLLLNTNNHDLGAKTLLSYPGSTTTTIPACTNCTNATNIAIYANASMDQALDNIFYHPTLGPYVSKILIQHMVTSDPTPAYVSRVAGIFNNNGANVRGDMRAVVRAILLDPEARGDAKTDPNYGKLREPFQLATNFLRQFNVRSADGSTLSDGVLILNGRNEYLGMGQNPFRSPTVFNYFPPSFVIPNTSLVGPEFALMTTGTAIQRANWINRFTFSAIPFTVNLPDVPNGTSVDFSDLQTMSASDPSGNLLLDELNRRMLHSTMSAGMRSVLLPAVTSVAASDTLGRARQAVYLIATSSQFQVQR